MLESDPHKFLGYIMTNNNTAQDHLNIPKDKLGTQLANVDKTKVRGEFKVAIYVR